MFLSIFEKKFPPSKEIPINLASMLRERIRLENLIELDHSYDNIHSLVELDEKIRTILECPDFFAKESLN